MKQQDKIIQEVLLSKMYRIDNAEFADKIVNQYLLKKDEKIKHVKFDFISLIAGLVFVIVLLGLVILIMADEIQGVTFDHVFILFSMTLMYLVFRLLNDIFMPGKVSG